MASNSNSTNPPAYGSDPTSPNTTFVQADPSTFRSIVQKLTGVSDDPSIQKLPLTHHHPSRPVTNPGLKRPTFKLQERRQSGKNLQINLNSYNNNRNSFRQRGLLLVSPVSPLDLFGSPRSPREEPCARGEEEEEIRAIAEKGFYLHQISPLSTPRATEPPELLPLFPLKSPRENDREDNNSLTEDCNSSCS